MARTPFPVLVRAAGGAEAGGASLALASRDDGWRMLAPAADPPAGWDIARAARAALITAGPDGRLSANRLRMVLPERAHHLIPGVLKALRLCGLITATGTSERSTLPESKAGRVVLYRLTPAGRDLASEVRPPLLLLEGLLD